MNNILVLTEKKFIENKIKEALPKVNCMSIEGHAYTSDEKDFLRVPQEILDNSPCYYYKDEKGVEEPVHILGAERINENCEKILEFLKNIDSDIDTIINACDFDKNGNYLFKYAIEDVMNLNDKQYIFKRMKLMDLTSDSIVSAFNNVFQKNKLTIAAVGKGMTFRKKISQILNSEIKND